MRALRFYGLILATSANTRRQKISFLAHHMNLRANNQAIDTALKRTLSNNTVLHEVMDVSIGIESLYHP
jgi:hypothetical protein